MSYKLGVDVGGTFTDFLLVSESGQSEVFKVSSTPRDPTVGFVNGLNMMAASRGESLESFTKRISIIVHGTTVTTNAVLTGNGAKTGLVTTKGFRDALQLRRGVKEEPYNTRFAGPKPLVPRSLRQTVAERMNYEGQEALPLDEEEVKRAGALLAAEGCKSVAICFMHSYANGDHERRAGELLRKAMPDAYITTSVELLPQIGFYERTSTVALNAYVGPILASYLSSLTRELSQIGFAGVLLIMQSNGGVASPSVAQATAASTLLSGPASGPIAGLAYAKMHGRDSCITIDMGGTSFDVALVKDGRPALVMDGSIERHLCALPMMAIYTVGAGGGSIAYVDKGGLLHVGPESAGAVPGPACYDRGGTRPTSTDADLHLGYLAADYFLGGELPLDGSKADKAIREHVADPLGIGVTEAAYGIYHMINVTMANAIKEVSIKRGYDPRDFPLIIAGGAGPVHAGMIALELGIPFVIVPKVSSVFCAVGMLMCDLRHELVVNFQQLTESLDVSRLRDLLKQLRIDGYAMLSNEGITEDRMLIDYACDMRYLGQFHEIIVRFTEADVFDSTTAGSALERLFHEAHLALYGYSVEGEGNPIQVMNVRASVTGLTDKPEFSVPPKTGATPVSAIKGRRQVYIPTNKKFEEVDVYDGMKLESGANLKGPAIIEQPNTTVFVPPEYELTCDSHSNYIMRLIGSN